MKKGPPFSLELSKQDWHSVMFIHLAELLLFEIIINKMQSWLKHYRVYFQTEEQRWAEY